MLAAPHLPLSSSSYRPPLRTHTLPSTGTLQMLGQGCRNASPETRQSRVDGIFPRRGGGNRAEVYLPPESLLYSLALAPGRLRIRFLLFKVPSYSFIHTSDQGQGNLGAGFRSDPCLSPPLSQPNPCEERNSLSLKKKRGRNPVPCQSDFALGDLTLGTLSSACEK